MNADTITKIYGGTDDFCKAPEACCKARCLPEDKKGVWFPASRLSISEVMAVILLFRLSGYRCFKRKKTAAILVNLLILVPVHQ